jgi:hypothetical protein
MEHGRANLIGGHDILWAEAFPLEDTTLVVALPGPRCTARRPDVHRHLGQTEQRVGRRRRRGVAKGGDEGRAFIRLALEGLDFDTLGHYELQLRTNGALIAATRVSVRLGDPEVGRVRH